MLNFVLVHNSDKFLLNFRNFTKEVLLPLNFTDRTFSKSLFGSQKCTLSVLGDQPAYKNNFGNVLVRNQFQQNDGNKLQRVKSVT